MARRTRIQVLALLPVVMLTSALAACGGGGNSGGGSTQPAAGGVQLVKSGELTTCTHLPYEPFQVQQGDKIVGFDVDLVNLVAKELGVTQKVIDTPFETIQTGEDMNVGKCDLAAAGMTINDVRRQNFDFSDPYFDASQALLVKKGSGINSLDQLKGKKLGVQSATTGAEYAQKNASAAVISTFEDFGLQVQAVLTGQLDAAINDNGVLLDYARKNPTLDVTKEFNTGEKYGIGVKKGNTALLSKINDVLKKSKSDGSYDKIYEKWFGKKPESRG